MIRKLKKQIAQTRHRLEKAKRLDQRAHHQGRLDALEYALTLAELEQGQKVQESHPLRETFHAKDWAELGRAIQLGAISWPIGIVIK